MTCLDPSTLPRFNGKWTREAYRACANAGMARKQTAELLGVTISAVSQAASNSGLSFVDQMKRVKAAPPKPKPVRPRLPTHTGVNGVSLPGVPMDAPADFRRTDETAPRGAPIRHDSRADRPPRISTAFVTELRRQVMQARGA